ncbi:MAG: glycosyltransferase family 2 protein [Ruminococcaceae bacterium]|nr:glycosyltransferase family 2 protein [Oscillospiraceae bacterium]
MLLSVVIPAYNCINSLEQTLDSILDSGLRDFEVLLIDDGSRDGTSELCDELQRRHDCVRCVHQENGGVSNARNRGVQEARGSYILFFDSDDTVDSGALTHCEEILLRNQPDMLVFGMSFDYYFRGTRYRRDAMTVLLEGLLPRARWLREIRGLYECNALSPVWNKCIRRDLLEKNRILFPGGMIEMEDFWFSLRCMRYCEEICFLPEAIYRYRQPEDESNTFRRLCRIPSISAYMEPFEEELAAFPETEGVAGSIYASFFHEMIRFGDVSLIRRTAVDMLNGKYAGYMAASEPGLYRLLQAGRYRRVWLRSRMRSLRHWLAVRVKYVRNGGKTE